MALGKSLGHSNPNQGSGGKYLRPEVSADRDVINHIWASINDLHDRAMEGQVTVQTLDDFADFLRQDYGVQADIVGEGHNFRLSQVGSHKTSTGAILARHVEKIHNQPEGELPSITGHYICEQFGLEVARRSSLERQALSGKSLTSSVPRSRQPRASTSSTMIDDTAGFDDLLDDGLEESSEDVSGGAADGDAIQDNAFATDHSEVDSPQDTALAQLSSLDWGDDEADENLFEPPSQASQPTPMARTGPPLSRLETPQPRPSDVVQPPRSHPTQTPRLGRDPLDSTLSDAASTLSGLASSNTDGVTVMADAGEVVAVAAAATMLGLEVVKQIQQSRNSRHWERLVALGQEIEATEERGRHMAERLVKVEDAFATREGQTPADSEQASAPQRESDSSSSEAAATARLETQTEGVNDLNERVSALGQPSPSSERLRAPKLDSKAPISQRLDALEAYLFNINQTLDHIEERLTVLEKEVGLAAPGQDVSAGRDRPRAAHGSQNGASSPSRLGQSGDKRVRPKRSRTLSQIQA